MNETVTQIYVQVVGGPAQEKKLLDSSLTIGSDGTDIIIDHPHISPLHCTLFNRSGIISIIDHNSDYGVAINDKRIAPNKMIMLMKNDRIQCGELEIKFFVDTLHAQSTNSLIEEDDNTLILNRNSDGTLTSLRAANETKTKINENLESDDEIQITSTQIVPAGFVPPGSTNADSLVQFMNEHDEKENAKAKSTEEDEKTQVWSPMKNSNTTTGKIELDTEEEPIQQPTKSSAILKIDTDELDQSKENTTQQNTEPTNTRTNTVNELKPEKEMELSKASIKIGNKIQGSKPATNFQSQKLLKPSRRRWSSFVDFNSMTFPVRMAAFLIDVILSVKLVQFLIQENMLDEIQLVQSFSFFGIDFFLEQTKIHFDPTYAQSVLGPYVAAFLIIRVISSFIFGVTIGQVLCGVQSEGNIFFKRIFAVVREILGILTGPFLIFDLPALFAKKTIKEILSLSKLYQLDRSSYVLMLIMPPIIFALCYLGPMLEGESHFQKIAMDLKTEVVSAKTGSTNPDEIAPRLVNVNFLQTQFPVGNQERTLAMGLQKTYLENVTRPFPSMKILFLNPSLVVNWQKIKNIDLGTILAKAVNEKNGWLEKKFPEIKKYILREKFNQQEFITEFKTLCQDAFNLEWKTLPITVLYYGPFYVGLLDFRDAFFSNEGINGNISEFKIVQIQDEFVLQTSFKAENQTSPTPGKVSYQWLTLGGGMNSSLFRIDIRGESVDQWESKLAQVKEKFLSLVKISKVQKLQQVELNFPNNRMLNMGEIIDFFAQGQKRILSQASLLPKISEHLKKLTDKLLAQKNLFLLEDYKKELERLKIWLTDLSTDRPDPSFQIPINQFILELDSYRNMIQTATTTPSSAPSTSTAAPAPAAPPTSP